MSDFDPEMSADVAGLTSTVLIYKKSMLHPKAHPQAVLEALEDMAAAVGAQLGSNTADDDGQWRSLDLLALLKATDMGKVVNGLRKYPSRRVAALADQVFHAWKHIIATNVLGVHNMRSSGSVSTSTARTSPAVTIPESCPPSPHVYVVIDDDAADEVMLRVAASVTTNITVAALTSSPAPTDFLQPAPACHPMIAPSPIVACAPLVAMKSSFNDVESTPVDPLVHNQTSSLSCTARYREKVEASKRKLQMGYERERAAKRHRTICLLGPDQLHALQR